jgi:rhomboid protease GluP
MIQLVSSLPWRRTWVTILSCAACIVIWMGLSITDDYENWETLSRFGVLPAESIWRGHYWALITSAFVHFAIWHCAFNIYWWWTLGSVVEREIGSRWYLLFVLAAAIVSSSFQMAFSDDTGIGASGVVYALFGLMWPLRQQVPQFKTALTSNTIQLFVGWMLICILLEATGAWQLGNAAHISGFLFGGGVAGSFLLKKSSLIRFSLFALVAISFVPLFWAPWSVRWLSQVAYQEHLAGRLESALHRYNQIIDRAPENAWAYANRSSVHEALGHGEQAEADSLKASELSR